MYTMQRTLEIAGQSDKILEYLKKNQQEDAYHCLYKLNFLKTGSSLNVTEKLIILYTQAVYFNYKNQTLDAIECCKDIVSLQNLPQEANLYLSRSYFLYSHLLFAKERLTEAFEVAKTGLSLANRCEKNSITVELLENYMSFFSCLAIHMENSLLLKNEGKTRKKSQKNYNLVLERTSNFDESFTHKNKSSSTQRKPDLILPKLRSKYFAPRREQNRVETSLKFYDSEDSEDSTHRFTDFSKKPRDFMYSPSKFNEKRTFLNKNVHKALNHVKISPKAPKPKLYSAIKVLSSRFLLSLQSTKALRPREAAEAKARKAIVQLELLKHEAEKRKLLNSGTPHHKGRFLDSIPEY